MELWRKVDLTELLHKAEKIQNCLKDMQSEKEIGMVSKKFAALMKKGNVNAAINLFSESMRNGILPLGYPQPKKITKMRCYQIFQKEPMLSNLNQLMLN